MSERAPLRVMFHDEARFGRIVDLRRCWCPKPWRPVCRAVVSRQYTYAYAAASVSDGHLDTLVLPHVNAECMQLFVNELARRHPNERIVLVIDGAGWHHEAALQWPPNVRPLLPPPYSPELNPVEHLWDELRCPDKSGQRLLGRPRPFVVEMLLREDRRRYVAQPAMAALAVVKDLDPLPDRRCGLSSRRVALMVDHLRFERAPEGLHRGVVEAVSSA